MRSLAALAAASLLLPSAAAGQPSAPHRHAAADGTPRVALVKNAWHGSRNVAELSDNPDYLMAGGLLERLREGGVAVERVDEVDLTPEEKRQYGEWNRLGLANGHLAEMVAANEARGLLTVGLLGNCNSVMGVLGGLQSAGPEGSWRKVGFVFIDAHGDFNTPETTLSGMLGGMPVAVSAGHALERLRLKSGLEQPLPMDHIVWGGVRDLDPLEAERFEEHGSVNLTVRDLREVSPRLHREMERLSRETDVIYVHIDMDVLDPAEVPGHGLNVPDGPTSDELGRALTAMFSYPKVAALGIASTPANERDPDGVSRRAAYRLIDGAIAGVRAR